MKRYLVVLLIIYSLLTNHLFSQNDSSQVELGLDYLSGKIIGGVDGELFYDNYRGVDKIYHNLYYSLMYGSKNLFSIQYVADHFNDWGGIHQSFQINFRPQNSIQFYCTPFFRESERNVSTNNLTSHTKYSDKTTGIGFGAAYLSDGGKINYQRKKSAWWYYSYGKFDGNSSTYFYLNSTMFFLNSGQFYIQLNSNYSNSVRNSPVNMYYSGIKYPGRSEDKSHYAGYNLTIDYNLFDKIWISSLIQRSNNSRNEKELSSFTPENTDPIPATNTKTYGNSWNYKLNCNFFITDNLFNKLYYNLRQSKQDDYVDPLSYYMGRNSKSSDHALCYQLIWLTCDKPVKLQKILSDYNNYYGHLLPQNEFKWLFEITYSQYNSENKWMINPTVYNKDKGLSRYFAIRQAIDYGITNSANLSFGGLMEHNSNPGLSSDYDNLSRMQMQISFAFYNYSYTENTMNWMTLSDFDYRHGGALLKKGMMKFNLELDSPTYEYGWSSNKLSWFNFKWSKLKNIYDDFSVHADFSAGVYHNIELTSSISSPIFPKQYPLNVYFNNYIKWQPFKKQRIILYFPFNWKIEKRTTGEIGRVKNNSFTLSWVFLF